MRPSLHIDYSARRSRARDFAAARSRGFSMVEVLVSLIIIAVGMLGLAKIQALAYASTGIASQQSIAALEAASLASAMRADRNYWSAVTTPFTYTATATTISSPTDGTLTGIYACASGGSTPACTAPQIAAYDLQAWVTAINAVLPKPTATISCPAVVTAGTPIGCTIKISWQEETVDVNTTSAGNAMTAAAYTLYVVP